MKLPKFLRRLTLISFIIFMVLITTSVILSAVLNHPAPLMQLPWPEKYSIILAGVSFVVMLLSWFGSLIARSLENASLQRSGLPASAKVLAIRDTGETDNQNPVVRVKLKVYPEGGTPFEAVAEDLISRLAVADLEPGSKVAVRYNPKTKEVALEHVKSSKAAKKEADF